MPEKPGPAYIYVVWTPFFHTGCCCCDWMPDAANFISLTTTIPSPSAAAASSSTVF